MPSLSKEDAQQAFIKYASEKCCYSTKPAENGVITKMEAFNTHRYRLKTFTETRRTQRSQRPYYGELIDTSGQTPPGLWQIPVNAPPFFEDGNQIIEIPHTSSVKGCIPCHASGIICCSSCNGVGAIICSACNGFGTTYYYPNRQICMFCYGLGRKNCWQCSMSGWTKCAVCLGQRRVRVFINLIVNWCNNIDEYTVEQSSGLKMHKLCKVRGEVLFRESNHMVYPVTNFPDPAVVQTSERLLSEHKGKCAQTSRILQQCQTIKLLPITKVTYEWKGESHEFFVYGTDFRVSAEDYPAACCGCCCAVM